MSRSKGIKAAREAAAAGQARQPFKRQLMSYEPTRKLNRRERRQISKSLRIPLPRRLLYQRLKDPATNQRRMEIAVMVEASRLRRKKLNEAELLEERQPPKELPAEHREYMRRTIRPVTTVEEGAA